MAILGIEHCDSVVVTDLEKLTLPHSRPEGVYFRPTYYSGFETAAIAAGYIAAYIFTDGSGAFATR